MSKTRQTARDYPNPTSADRSRRNPATAGTMKTEPTQAAEAKLVAQYGPIGIAAIAAAFALR